MEGTAMELEKKKCVPCEGGATTLPADAINRLLSQLSGWHIEPEAAELRKRFKFASFVENIAFVNRMATLAEAEGHHPDFCVRYTNLDVSLTTHAIGGLSENDFILAAKIDQLRL
jgi:4a-hydroxytetrahydrobiopterin dehydratase